MFPIRVPHPRFVRVGLAFRCGMNSFCLFLAQVLKHCTAPERKVMSTTSTPVLPTQESTAARLRNLGLSALFAFVMLVPRLVNLRRDRRSWFAFRVLLAITGASLVILPLSLWNSWTAGIAGLAMFLAAILLPAAKPDTTLADTATRLGALAIVNGGFYQPEQGRAERALVEGHWGTGLESLQLENEQFRNAQADDVAASPVRLFVCADRIWALDSQQQPLLVIPTAQIVSAIASESAGDWIVRVRWADHAADFHYQGLFAEHLARVAESTLQSVIQPTLPVIPRKRAATA